MLPIGFTACRSVLLMFRCRDGPKKKLQLTHHLDLAFIVIEHVPLRERDAPFCTRFLVGAAHSVGVVIIRVPHP